MPERCSVTAPLRQPTRFFPFLPTPAQQRPRRARKTEAPTLSSCGWPFSGPRRATLNGLFDPRQHLRSFLRKHLSQLAQQIQITIHAAPQRFGIKPLAFQMITLSTGLSRTGHYLPIQFGNVLFFNCPKAKAFSMPPHAALVLPGHMMLSHTMPGRSHKR